MNTKTNAKELRNIQKELIDTIITKPDELKKIIQLQLASRKGFHQYSFNNLLLANYQLHERKGHGIELIAPYKKWANGIKTSDGRKIHRNVKYGEKALYILAPVRKQINKPEKEDNNTNDNSVEPEYITFFRRVPVFDLSQTTGDKMEIDFTSNNNNFTLNEIISRCDIKVNFTDTELTRGYTDGKEIWISKHISNSKQICTFFHELAHILLHFDDGEKVSRCTRELDAEAVSYIVSSYIGVQNDESPAYILNWTGAYDDDARSKLLKGKGSKVLGAVKWIIGNLDLDGLLDSKSCVVCGSRCIGVLGSI